MRMLRTISSSPLAVRLSLLILSLFVLVGSLAPFIANDKPIFLKVGTEKYWPIWSDLNTVSGPNGDVLRCEYEYLKDVKEIELVWPLIPFAPGKANISGMGYPPPGTVTNGRTHFLGANNVGEDTLAGVVHGARISLKVGFASAVLLLLIGLAFGVLAGYFGNDMVRLNLFQILLICGSVPVAWFYGFQSRQYTLADTLASHFGLFLIELVLSALLFTGIIALSIYLSSKFLSRMKWKKNAIPFDNLVGRFMEFFSSLPTLILLVSITTLAKPSMYLIILIIGFTSWVSVARYSRAEILKLRHSDFMNNCRLMGMSHARIVVRHLLPNAMGPALVAFTFGVAGAILAEAGLSYLGIGIPNDVVTWGKLLAEAKENFDAWWLIWTPGALIFIVLLSLNTLGEYFRKRINPALRES